MLPDLVRLQWPQGLFGLLNGFGQSLDGHPLVPDRLGPLPYRHGMGFEGWISSSGGRSVYKDKRHFNALASCPCRWGNSSCNCATLCEKRGIGHS